MFLDFFYLLRANGLGSTLHEYLTLLEALRTGVIGRRVDEFYALCRTIFIKQEGQLDRFDQLFGAYFQGLQFLPDDFLDTAIPRDWLEQVFRRELSEEERAAIEKLGGLDGLLERFRELLEEQREAHRGGNKWIGVGGSSPFGHSGHHPEGFRMGGEGGGRGAIKVWQRRDFRNLDDSVELQTRHIKMVLKRLRLLTREGRPEELDLDATIRQTSENAGVLDIALQPSRKNRVKVLLLMDVGGSMDEHIALCEQFFSAARWEFKHLEFFYFHNCVYEKLWRDNRRRHRQTTPTLELISTFPRDYKLIFVGDAAMSPYEIFYRGGSVEHYNDEPGIHWLNRLKDHFPHLAWINPLPEYEWDYYESTDMLRRFTGHRMFPLTLKGLTAAMRCLQHPHRTYRHQIWNEDEAW